MLVQFFKAVNSGCTAGFQLQGIAQRTYKFLIAVLDKFIFHQYVYDGQCRCQLQGLVIFIQWCHLLFLKYLQSWHYIFKNQLKHKDVKLTTTKIIMIFEEDYYIYLVFFSILLQMSIGSHKRHIYCIRWQGDFKQSLLLHCII